MRLQTTAMNLLLCEFNSLKAKLFDGSPFAIFNETDPDTLRYSRLLQYFYPQFRTRDFVSPLEETIIMLKEKKAEA